MCTKFPQLSISEDVFFLNKNDNHIAAHMLATLNILHSRFSLIKFAIFLRRIPIKIFLRLSCYPAKEYFKFLVKYLNKKTITPKMKRI